MLQLLSVLENAYEYIYSIPVFEILQKNFTVISFSLYTLWCLRAYLSSTTLIVNQTSVLAKIMDKMTTIHSGYRPTLWCVPSALNTLVHTLIQKTIKLDYKRELLTCPDGGIIAIDWANLDAPKKAILLVLPGITSSSQENYVTHFVDEAIKTGCSAVVMNYRGISIDLATPRTYCATNYDDLDMVVQHIHNKYSDRKIIAVGISMGGIKLGGYLAKQFDDCLISNAMIVSAPMNGMLTINELEKLHNFFTLNILLARCLKEYFSRHKHWFKDDKRFDCSAIARSLSIRDFDSQFITKQFGYKTCHDYYMDASLDAKIQNIKVPTLFLNAGDDMFSPERAFPIEKIKANPYTAMVWTKHGGHIGFCEGILPSGCNYACRFLRDYLQNIFS